MVLLVLHILGLGALLADLLVRHAVLRRLGTPKGELASTNRLLAFSKAPVGLAYVTILVTGSIMIAPLCGLQMLGF